MKVYVHARRGLIRYPEIVLALLTWVESARDREVVVWSVLGADEAEQVGRRYLNSSIPFEAIEECKATLSDLDAAHQVILTDDETFAGIAEFLGNMAMHPSKFAELVHGDAYLDFECFGCGNFFSELPFLETEIGAYCSNCSPRMASLFEEAL